MKLSKTAKLIHDGSDLGSDISQLIGQFCGSDTSLRRGDAWYEIFHRLGSTFIKCTDKYYPAGYNEYINVNTVVRSTPCSVLLKYEHTFVLSNLGGQLVRYQVVIPELKHTKPRRIYPTRLKRKLTQNCFKTYVALHDIELDAKATRYKNTMTYTVPATSNVTNYLDYQLN